MIKCIDALITVYSCGEGIYTHGSPTVRHLQPSYKLYLTWQIPWRAHNRYTISIFMTIKSIIIMYSNKDTVSLFKVSPLYFDVFMILFHLRVHLSHSMTYCISHITQQCYECIIYDYLRLSIQSTPPLYTQYASKQPFDI